MERVVVGDGWWCADRSRDKSDDEAAEVKMNVKEALDTPVRFACELLVKDDD